MLEWIGLIPLLGLTGNWRGYKMGDKAFGGVMDADMKGKFEAAMAKQSRSRSKPAQSDRSRSKPAQSDSLEDLFDL